MLSIRFVRPVILVGTVFVSSAHAAPGLITTPIPLDDASGKTPPVATETAPCPFLSDDTALSAIRTRQPLPRFSVSNTRCVWKRNAGFRLDVTIEPAASAKPFAERHYNMDRKTQVDAIPGPGTDAVVLSHTSWGKPIAYALGFKLADNAVFIRATGLRTTGEQLHQAAREIAQRLPNAAPIEAQQRLTRPAFDNCTTWTAQSLAGLLELPASQPVRNESGNTYCSWLFGKKGSAGYPHRVGISYGRYSKGNWKKLQRKRGATLQDGFGKPVLKHVIRDDYGHVVSLIAQLGKRQVSVSVTDRTGNARDAEVAKLMDNVLARLKE